MLRAPLKARASFLVVLLLSFALAACGSSSAPTSTAAPGTSATTASAAQGSTGTAPITLRVGDTGGATSISGQAEKTFARLVDKYSNGAIQVKVYYNSQLGTFGQMASAMKTGGVNAMFIQPDALGLQVKLAQVDAWPFMFQNATQMLKAWNSPQGQQLINEIEKESGYLLVGPTWNAPRNIILNRTVANLAAAKGMKVRVPGEAVYLDEMRALGLSPTSMNIADVMTGMQQNVVNGMEATIEDAAQFQLQNAAKTIITDGHVIAPKTWIFWGAWVNGLSAANKQAVLKAAKDASASFSAQAKAQEASLIQQFKAKGVKFVSPGLTFAQMKQMEAGLAKQLPTLAKWAKLLEQGAQ